MRPILVLIAASLAAVSASAQKPGADPAQGQWRTQAASVCIAELARVDGLQPPALAAICGCAADRYLDTHREGALPAIDAAAVRGELGGRLLACTIQEQPDSASDVGRWLAQAVRTAPPDLVVPPAPLPAAGDKPPAEAEDGGGPSRDSGIDLAGWWESLRARIAGSGIPLWGWVPIILIVLLVLRGLMRRRDRDDLIAPPRGSQRPRGPDLPRN